jgi:hypothetical protein
MSKSGENVNKKNSVELKEHFLENASALVDEYIGAALGMTELSSNNANCREEVWDLLKKLMLQASSRMFFEIGSMEDILVAVSKGECTIEEGKELISMYKQVREAQNIGVDAIEGTPLPILNITLRDENGEREIKRSSG